MHITKYHSIRLFFFWILLFLSGVVTTVIATTTIDSNTETRANTIWSAIQSNASNMNTSDVISYYQLVRLNIKTLIEVLSIVDKKIIQELSLTWLPTDTWIIGELTNTGKKNPTPNTSCSGLAPTGEGIIKSTSVFGMVGSETWSYVANTKGTSTDLGMSCQWTCAPGYTRFENTCTKAISELVDPKTIYTDSSLTTVKNTFTIGDTLYGYVSGGDKNNLWGCMDIPGGNDCKNNKWWRQLTKSYYDPITAKVIEDGWQINPNHNGRVELQQWFYLAEGYPVGIYTGYTRTWLTGKMVSTTFTVVAKAKSCSWWATYGPCNPGTCSTSNIGAQACGGTCACN